MAVKSVIEIDVLDEKFKAFQAAFEKYKKSVDEQSKKWKEFNKTISEAEKRQKDFNKALQDGGQALKSAVVSTASIASNMASAAVSAAKWMAYSAVAGGFGLGGLASSASNLRRDATGLGVNTSQLRAARTYGEPYLGGIEGVMSNIQTLQTTLTEQYKVGILGGDLNKNAYQNLIPALQRIREAKTQSGGMIDVAMNTIPGIKDVASQEQVQTIWNMKPDEFARLISSLGTGEKNFPVDDAKYESFRQFWVGLKEAGNVIENSLIKNLDTLTPQLKMLSKTIADTIDELLSSKQFKEAMETLNEGIKEFGKYLKSGEAKEDVSTFLEALKALAKGVVATAEFFGLIPDKSLKNQPTGLNWLAQAKESGWAGHVENGQQIAGANERVNGQLQKYNNASVLKGVDPVLANSIKALGLNPISGYRTEEYARSLGIWHEGSHHTLLNAQGKASAVDIQKSQVASLMAKYTDQELKEQFDIYRPYPKDPNEQNHFERWSTRNESKIYVYVNGELQPMSNMAGQQR
jgi:hypothetical protein